jgi:hypothetical protein
MTASASPARGSFLGSVLYLVLSSIAISSAIAAGDPRFKELAEKMAQVFESRNPYAIESLGEEIRALELPAGLSEAERNDWQNQKVALWMSAVDGARKDFDEDFEQKDPPSLNLVPMLAPGEGTNSGMDPREIRDPQARADYERRIAENTEKAKSYVYQRTLDKVIKEWSGEISLLYEAAGVAERNAVEERRVRTAVNAQDSND